MKRKGIYRPTIEDIVEISGIEVLHPGGYKLTKRTAELCELKEGMKVLDVSSGRGTQSVFYAKKYGVHVTGLDISKAMIKSATTNAKKIGLSDKLNFVQGDSQVLPFSDNSFDAVINECAVGIPDDSQKVLNEMLRVVKPGGSIAIHETVWKKKLTKKEKDSISERYGTTPLELNEWEGMLEESGAVNILIEFKEWSKPVMFWDIREGRKVKNYKEIMLLHEKVITATRIFRAYGFKGVLKAFENEKHFFDAVQDGKIGYALYRGEKPKASAAF